MEEQEVQSSPRSGLPRRDEMKTPDDVSAMVRLKGLGWGAKRIAAELGCSKNTVKRWLRYGDWRPCVTPSRSKKLDGLSDWLAERFRRHRGNADVIRQELAQEKDIHVSLRTVECTVAPLRRELVAEARATVRFETPPGEQLQIDFGERRVEIGGVATKVFFFVATLGYSRRLHVRAFGHEKQESWFSGMESTFQAFGGIPREVLLDNARALVLHHDPSSREVVLHPRLHAFAKHWGFRIRACAPYRLCEEERHRRPTLRQLGRDGGASGRLDARHRRSAYPWHDRRGTDRSLPARGSRGPQTREGHSAVHDASRSDAQRRCRLRGGDRRQCLFGAVAADRRAGPGHRRQRDRAHPPWRARGGRPCRVEGAPWPDRRRCPSGRARGHARAAGSPGAAEIAARAGCVAASAGGV